MIDLTPLDVRKKKGDFRRGMRGYDPEVVDGFLDIVADRMEALVRENVTLRERADQLTTTMDAFRERERAMNEALISAQQLREETRAQAQRDAELTLREARAQADELLAEGRRQLAAMEEALARVQRQRATYLRSLRSLVERNLQEVQQEEDRLHDLLRADYEPTPPPATAPSTNASEWLRRLDEGSPPAAD
jgi:DivIVA domain-containing protein